MKIKSCPKALYVALLLLASRMHAQVVELQSEAQYQEILKNSRPAVIKFSADWCGACKSIKDEFNKVSQDAQLKNVTFVNVDIDKFQTLAQQNGVAGIPTFLYVQNGTVKKQEVGVNDTRKFGEAVRNNIRSQFNNINTSVEVEHTKTEVTTEKAPLVHDEHVVIPDAGYELGIVAKIKALFVSAYESLRNMIMEVIEWIKGLFGR